MAAWLGGKTKVDEFIANISGPLAKLPAGDMSFALGTDLRREFYGFSGSQTYNGYAIDPNPVLAQNAIVNRIPQIQTREMESILRIRNGDIAVLGGLMQDTRAGDTNQIPGLGSIPGLGELFKARNDKNTKTELVIFLRPVILNQESQYDVVRQFKSPTASNEWQGQPKGATP